jgi:hypothetical protein
MSKGAGHRVRIALVDDQALVLKGLSALLAEFADLEIALESLDAGQLLPTRSRGCRWTSSSATSACPGSTASA